MQPSWLLYTLSSRINFSSNEKVMFCHSQQYGRLLVRKARDRATAPFEFGNAMLNLTMYYAGRLSITSQRIWDVILRWSADPSRVFLQLRPRPRLRKMHFEGGNSGSKKNPSACTSSSSLDI